MSVPKHPGPPRLPEIVRERDLKALQCDRLDIHQQAMPAGIDLFAAGHCLQAEAAFPLLYLHRLGMQQQPAGSLVVDQFLQKGEQQQIQLFVLNPDSELLAVRDLPRRGHHSTAAPIRHPHTRKGHPKTAFLVTHVVASNYGYTWSSPSS